jgi:hypothetical protein
MSPPQPTRTTEFPTRLPTPQTRRKPLLRNFEEHPETTIDEAALAASCLAALPGHGQADALTGAMPERATRRGPARGVASSAGGVVGSDKERHFRLSDVGDSSAFANISWESSRGL